MSRRRALPPPLGLLLLLLHCISAQQDDLDCPPGTHFSNGNCVSSMRVRFTPDASGSGFSGQPSQGKGNNNFGSGGGNSNFGPGGGNNFGSGGGNSNFGSGGGNTNNFGNSNGNNNYNDGNNKNNGGYGQRKPSSNAPNRPSNSNKAPRPKPSPAVKNPCPAGYILSNGICKPAYLHPLPAYPQAPIALPPTKCNHYGHLGYPYSSWPHLQQHPYHLWPHASHQAFNPYASPYGYPYHGAQYPYAPYLGSQLCPPGYTFVLGTGCKSPQRVSISKLSRDLDVEDEELALEEK